MNDNNLKIIQVSDLHFLKDGETMYGANPVNRFRAFINDVNKNQRNADLVVITGDIAHNGIKESYQLFKEELKRLDLPSVIMIGNHDNREVVKAELSSVTKIDDDGFIQSSIEIKNHKLIFCDTVWESKNINNIHEGYYCLKRFNWLEKEILSFKSNSNIIFMHHNPMNVFMKSMDNYSFNDKDQEIIAKFLDKYSSKIKYLFFGHGHRPLSGKWKNVPYASLRGLLHARELDFDSDVENFKMEEPSYGIIFVNENNLTFHIHDFMNKGKIYEGDENYLGFPNID